MKISRLNNSIKIHFYNGTYQEFERVVFATPPDQVLTLLSDATEIEIKRFSPWKKNLATNIAHTDSSLYEPYGIKEFSEFDFFQTSKSWGYNAYLNQLCSLKGCQKYSLAFNLADGLHEGAITSGLRVAELVGNNLVNYDLVGVA